MKIYILFTPRPHLLVVVQSIAQSCPTPFNPMDCSMPGFPVLQHLPGVCPNSCPLSQRRYTTISSSVVPFSSHPQSLPALGSFPMNRLFVSGGQVLELGSFIYQGSEHLLCARHPSRHLGNEEQSQWAQHTLSKHTDR